MPGGKLYDGNDRFCKIVAPEHHLALADQGLCAWPQKRITYYESLGLNAPGLDVHSIYDLAFKQWADVCGIQPVRVGSASGANISVGQGPIDGPWGTLAYSYLPCGSSADTQLTQLYDDGETWTYAFLLACACHEIGHALGLSHSSVGNLMAPILNQNITAPQFGDIIDIQARYGQAGVQPTPTPTPTPMPTPTPVPTPTPTPPPSGTLPFDGTYRPYTLAPGKTKSFPVQVPGSGPWFMQRRRRCSFGTLGIGTILTLRGKLGKVLWKEASAAFTMKLYPGSYTLEVASLDGQGGSFAIGAQIG